MNPNKYHTHTHTCVVKLYKMQKETKLQILQRVQSKIHIECKSALIYEALGL